MWMRVRLSCIWMGAEYRKACLMRVLKRDRRGPGIMGKPWKRFVDMMMDLSKRFPRLGFYFKSFSDNASFSTTLIGAVFRQVRRQEIMFLSSRWPKALQALNDAPCELQPLKRVKFLTHSLGYVPPLSGCWSPPLLLMANF